MSRRARPRSTRCATPSSTMSGADKVACRWGDARFTHTLGEITWMSPVAVLVHLNERATGDPARDWLRNWAHRWFIGSNLRVLVLGCGEGWLERAIAPWP